MTPDAGARPGEVSPADGPGPRELLRYRSAQGRWVVAAMILGSSVTGIDSTVVAVALLAIGRNLHVGFQDLQWTVTSYTLTLASLILLAGSLSDRWGRRRAGDEASPAGPGRAAAEHGDSDDAPESIKDQSVFFWPIAGDRKLPAVATRNIAAAASRLLLDASWSGVEEVPLLGPEDLPFNDMAEIMSQVLGKDVRQRTTFEAYKDRFVRLGMSDAMAQGYTDMAWAKNEGLDNGVQRTPENSTPTSFRQWCEEVLKPAVAS